MAVDVRLTGSEEIQVRPVEKEDPSGWHFKMFGFVGVESYEFAIDSGV